MWFLTTYLGSILTIMLKLYWHKRKKKKPEGEKNRFWPSLRVWAEQVAENVCCVCVYMLWFQMEIYWVCGIDKGVNKGLLSSFLIHSDNFLTSCKLWVWVCIFSWTQFMCHSRLLNFTHQFCYWIEPLLYDLLSKFLAIVHALVRAIKPSWVLLLP